MGDHLNKKIKKEDDLKKIEMKDNIKKQKNGR